MAFGTFVIHNRMYKGRQLEGKHLIDNKEWVLSSMHILSQGVLLDTSVNSEFSLGSA
jgi:hypothetical protein